MGRRNGETHRGRWAEWLAPVLLAVYLVIVALDGDWGPALLPAVYLTGALGHTVLRRRGHRRAATAVLVTTVAAVVVIAMVRQSWWLATVAGLLLVALAGLSLWSHSLREPRTRA